jgi:hypothetical protein
LDGFLDEAVHLSWCSVQHWDVEINQTQPECFSQP